MPVTLAGLMIGLLVLKMSCQAKGQATVPPLPAAGAELYLAPAKGRLLQPGPDCDPRGDALLVPHRNVQRGDLRRAYLSAVHDDWSASYRLAIRPNWASA
jgi:hypothetical protein